jgi:hypothetical protein
MAVQHGFGQMAGTDALTFAYDTGDRINSFKGGPTTNLLYDNGVINWTIGNLTVTVSRTTVIENSRYRITSGNFINQFTFGSFRFYIPLAKLTNGATYTMSFKWKLISGGSIFSMNDWNDTNLSNVVNVNYGEYNYAAATGVRATYDNTYRFMDFNISPNTVIEIWDVQLEQKSNASAFTTGTRESTQSLFDLKQNRVLDVANVSFSNTDQPTFDGTDDLIFANVTVSAQQSKSYESVIRLSPSFSLRGSIFAGARGTTNSFDVNASRLLVAAEDDLSLGSPTVLALNTWYHVAYTFELISSTNCIQRLYVNGVQTAMLQTTTYSDSYITSATYVGYDTRFFQYFNGDIAVMKVYNKTLSDQELQSNYKIYKNRFGL